jgi:hypothetical protein
MLCCVLESRIYEFSTVLSEQAPALIAVPQVFKIGSFIFFFDRAISDKKPYCKILPCFRPKP